MFVAMVVRTKRDGLREVGLLVVFLQVMWNSVDTEFVPARCGDVFKCFLHLVFDQDHPLFSYLSWIHLDLTRLRAGVLVVLRVLALISSGNFRETMDVDDSVHEPSGVFVGCRN